ncbi:hypothetical protein SCLCIDRAFT_543741 [Scleroderma citrinum Foug A]|uniref:Uncharacterized protein n=1 Tax=Scleroderma citrinum Foug A TaxID=1036808 RepID=A0A0C2ZV39_9AGAM|nr:hypothetical protein SCLCIDRAFT_543741 [Scleroderma citrinum Foug A]
MLDTAYLKCVYIVASIPSIDARGYGRMNCYSSMLHYSKRIALECSQRILALCHEPTVRNWTLEVL